ncbi:methyltransferase domain-containing protein [Streptomyces naphthomycinicus]|uniref:methyltransferase domain-containing protein n=1 Tax=Streptomyces naphthomycinicus TaxID=2872625 RepID=UPI001CED2B33|nr:methyltransferase domain-containing protein [Streptomyces sp. TML10]
MVVIASDLDRLQRSVSAAMDQRGDWPERSAWIRDAVDALPRHRFAPQRLWRWDGHAYVPVDRDQDAAGWASEVYPGPDAATVTQVTDQLPTSSLSSQAVVVDMLDSLLLEPGHRVLELGTGNGWNAALLNWRTGPAGCVVSLEADPDLAHTAHRALTEAGAMVQVQVGDGNQGWAPAAPYDRVIATYAVERIPWAWVEQTKPGGRIVTPWGRLGHVALTVADDARSATGWVQGLAQFMPDRRALAPEPGFTQVRARSEPDGERPFLRDLAPLQDDVHLRFALRVALPRMRIALARDADGLNAWIHDTERSWTVLSAIGGGRTIATQGGPRHLADELEAAWDTWRDLGQPALYDFGMTVTDSGTTQYMWVNDADIGPHWPIT